VNALASDRVADYINENFVATYMKVGTFEIINGQKVGGNVASYFCQPDGAVIHMVPGKVGADALLTEARWANDARTYALTRSTALRTGDVDAFRFRAFIRQAHEERYMQEKNPQWARNRPPGSYHGQLPYALPKDVSTLGQAHWFLATNPLAKIDAVFPFVWQHILNEQLSGLPVAKR
jgi:hypothetical protein